MSFKWPSFGRKGWQVSPEYAVIIKKQFENNLLNIETVKIYYQINEDDGNYHLLPIDNKKELQKELFNSILYFKDYIDKKYNYYVVAGPAPNKP